MATTTSDLYSNIHQSPDQYKYTPPPLNLHGRNVAIISHNITRVGYDRFHIIRIIHRGINLMTVTMTSWMIEWQKQGAFIYSELIIFIAFAIDQ